MSWPIQGRNRNGTPSVEVSNNRCNHWRVILDAHQFDHISRSWVQRTPRRGLFRLVTAGLLARWSSRHGGQSVEAQESPEPTVVDPQGRIACAQDADCADGDLDPCTGATCVDGVCAFFIVGCIPGYVCCDNGACCPSGETENCLSDADCIPASSDPCAGSWCERGTCLPFLVTCAPGFVCCDNGSCCPEPTRECATDADCVVDATGSWGQPRCISGVCVPA